MGDLYASGGSSGYPAALDTATTQQDTAAPISFSAKSSSASKINNVASAIINIETELGTAPRNASDDTVTPADSAADVKTKINMILRRLKDIIGGTGWKDTAPVTLFLATHGQCQLTKSGANLLLSPYNGSKIVINSQVQSVPDAGVTLAIGAAVANTTYYIYAYMVGATMTLEFSATAPATQAGTGVKIKTGDATRSLVGLARANATPAWADSVTQRFVLSWFNRVQKGGTNVYTANRSTTSTTYVEVNTEIRVEFLTWAEEGVTAFALAWGNATALGYMSIGFDGATAEDTAGYVNAGNQTSAAGIFKSGLAEGYHFATLLGMNIAAGTLTLGGNASVGQRTSLQVAVRG